MVPPMLQVVEPAVLLLSQRSPLRWERVNTSESLMPKQEKNAKNPDFGTVCAFYNHPLMNY